MLLAEKKLPTLDVFNKMVRTTFNIFEMKTQELPKRKSIKNRRQKIKKPAVYAQ